jgi:hypothetical protein
MPKRVPRLLTTEQLNALLNNPDLFKVTVLGHAALEALVAAALSEALIDDPPKEVLGMPFARQVALLVGLGIIPRPLADALKRLGLIRNTWVHGQYEDRPMAGEIVELGELAAKVYPGRDAAEAAATAHRAGDPRFAMASAILMLYGSLSAYRDGYLERASEETIAFSNHFTPRTRA